MSTDLSVGDYHCEECDSRFVTRHAYHGHCCDRQKYHPSKPEHSRVEDVLAHCRRLDDSGTCNHVKRDEIREALGVTGARATRDLQLLTECGYLERTDFAAPVWRLTLDEGAGLE